MQRAWAEFVGKAGRPAADTAFAKLFAKRAKAALKASGLTQSDLARELEVTKQQVAQVLDGTSIPTLLTAMRIAQVLEVSTDYLAGLADE